MLTYKQACEIRERIHNTHFKNCEKCPIYHDNNGLYTGCDIFLSRHPKEAEKLLTDWDEKHPVRTILDEFKENYPNAHLDIYGLPDRVCPHHIGYEDDINTCHNTSEECLVCWSRPAKLNK